MYQVRISPEAKKGLKEIRLLYREALASTIDELKNDPFLGKPLGRELTGRFAIKIGTYRFIYQINVADRIITILSAGHRSTVYS